MKFAALLIPVALVVALFFAPSGSAPLPPGVALDNSAPTLVAEIASLPTVVPTSPAAKRVLPISTLPTPAPFLAAATLPTRAPTIETEPTPWVVAFAEVAPSEAPEPLRERKRKKCDPSYPEGRTCIPPGPPFAQGCAITDERNFTVLPPDPQTLDHDGDGIGCEPVGGSS